MNRINREIILPEIILSPSFSFPFWQNGGVDGCDLLPADMVAVCATYTLG